MTSEATLHAKQDLYHVFDKVRADQKSPQKVTVVLQTHGFGSLSPVEMCHESRYKRFPQITQGKHIWKL